MFLTLQKYAVHYMHTLLAAAITKVQKCTKVQSTKSTKVPFAGEQHPLSLILKQVVL